MKNSEKSQNPIFICKLCNKKCFNFKSLGSHIIKFHKIPTQIYYDKFLKKDTDEICKKCKNKTQFRNLARGYLDYCSRKCFLNSEEYLKKSENTNLIKYGVKWLSQNKNLANKMQIKRNKTKLEKYGDEKYCNKEKVFQTNIRKYGNKCSLNNIEIKKTAKETLFKNYGVEYNMQNKYLFEKNQKSGFKLKQFNNTNIWYRRTYELDFLENFYDKYPDIQNGPTIKYHFAGKNRVYFPDFYIPSLNLIVEIKSLYFYKKYEETIKEKERATISKGFKYLMIMDKNYININF